MRHETLRSSCILSIWFSQSTVGCLLLALDSCCRWARGREDAPYEMIRKYKQQVKIKGGARESRTGRKQQLV